MKIKIVVVVTFTYYHCRLLKPEGELDAPDSVAGAVAYVQVNPVLKRQLQFEGCFLDPERYDPVKRLGHGGYAKVHLFYAFLWSILGINFGMQQ